jgi:tripartite-type tricarboxylate transporter receptor subunit TctC
VMDARRRSLLAAAAALPLAARTQPAFPARPIRYIVPVAAGGGSDFVARALTEAWSRVLGQGFIVDNIGGGGGSIACQTTARAAADGHTLLQGYVATHGTSPATRSRLPYDALRDFTPVGMIGATPNVLVVNAALPVNTVAEFVDYARRAPGGLNYGSAGQGSLTHLTMELFKQQVGAFIVHLPYRGIAPAFVDLLGGQTQAMFPGLAAALPHIRAGRIRALAVTGPMRHPLLDQVPTMIEAGFKGFDATQWYGVVGPAGLPAPVLRLLNETLVATLGQASLHERLAGEAVQPMPMSPETFARFIGDEITRWTRLARERGIELDNN